MSENTRRPRMLDLYSCAGGAGVGYERAGFDVYSVDKVPQPHNPHPFYQGDALEVLRTLLAGGSITFSNGETLSLSDFAAIHASPPCQFYSVTRHTNAHADEYPDLVAPTRELLIDTGLPWVIENVEGAPLIDALTLCGSEFGLRAIDVDGETLALRRHRLFESSIWLMGAGGCIHDGTQVAGVYGGGRHRNVSDRDNPQRRGGYTPLGSVRADLMGIDWMTQHELSQAIPPAYTEFIGRQLIEQLAVTS